MNGIFADLGRTHEHRLLAALLSVPGQPICRDELIDWVWDERPQDPGAALNEVVRALRVERLRPIGLGDALIDGDGVYRLDVPAEWVDVHQFHTLTERAAQLDDAESLEFLAAALYLRRGLPLANLGGRRVEEYRRELADELRDTEIRYAAIEIGQGRAIEWLPRLDYLFRDRPADATVTEIYVGALSEAGRMSDALVVHEQHRRHRGAESHGLTLLTRDVAPAEPNGRGTASAG